MMIGYIESPLGLVVRTSGFHPEGRRFDPGRGYFNLHRFKSGRGYFGILWRSQNPYPTCKRIDYRTDCRNFALGLSST